jgi:trans-aconitate methyltransferase
VTKAINTGPREWDAETYDAVSDPQFEWGMEVLGRLKLEGGETVVDAGCGSGRVTAELLRRACPTEGDRGRRLRGDDR